ncbi:PD-(D/E)XK nuclease domain-containing protein [Ihubacter massiliensis]|uniref:PD-(D/E)XK nuclease domain-containing protein n=1 Tax=Hominibacterium faecale TaxID=2839743 RepID=A0A9J6QQZ2_9FIRM|nr:MULTISPECIES: PD-(D/E)XK nuclease domain-containing protein [Eubacteriales Family XIII. Incertae Sedis]MCI7304165.1 PD-(D/E)XK nuclease domain-containing protein [Clostridia bacterium]MDE8734598.1 PD-(D/E)XK nuclease domain-containing protein [Eubacteriales bacterium DFI.9.88]MDY3011818.1 PD-(D/E)XK nuclease domain-containing protein [Clostridiales Family XIII bacterium]MCO7123400.1 PD-(D/E)XK nuclease domain-containing protein [Ihubacter massiliensis]MCU7379657.1 PD-(D/E)XK nuclease domain
MNEIADCIEHNVDEVREDIVKLVAGIPVPIKLKGYSAAELQLDTRDEILSAMVVYGFLSYYDGCLQIPNHELMEKYEDVLTRRSMGEVKAIVDRSQKMLEATLAGEEETVAAILEEVHDKEILFLKYNDENALSCVITLCYLSARDDYYIEREAKSGKGYCDYLFLPKKPGKPAIVLELKVGGSCEEAIAQIRDKNYAQKAEGCEEILLVGINYDRVKQHQCRIVADRPQ